MSQPTGKRRGRPPKKKPEVLEDDDLIGGPSAVESKPETAPYRGSGAPLKPDLELAQVYGGVTADWLAQVFGSDRRTVQKKLAKAYDAQTGKDARGSMRYSIPHAAAYLIKPKVDILQWIKGLRPNDLPPMLNDSYWAAMLKRQKWEENARDLWRTEDVLNVLSDTAFLFKTTSQLWVEEIDRKHTLSPEMRTTLTTLVDSLLEQVHEKLIDEPNQRRTASTVEEDGAVPSDPNGSGDFDAVV